MNFPFYSIFFPCSTLILTAPKFSPALLVYAPILQPPSSFIQQSITCKTKQQGLTEHNLLDLTFGIEQQKQNSTKLEGNEKRNLRLRRYFPFSVWHLSLGTNFFSFSVALWGWMRQPFLLLAFCLYICVFLQVWNLVIVKFKVPMGPVIDSCRYF